MSKYPNLARLPFYDSLVKILDKDTLDWCESEMVWYENKATKEDIGDGGEHLSWFLCCVYGTEDICEFLADWQMNHYDDSDRTCDDCPPEECHGNCFNCYYRTV